MFLTQTSLVFSPRRPQTHPGCLRSLIAGRYPVLTAVNRSQHWCPMCVHYQFSCTLKLARKYEIEHWSWPSKTINWSADSFQINHITSMSDTWACNMVMWYWSVAILFWQLSIDHFVNVQYTRCGLAKTHLRHPSLPFDSLPYPTLTICRRVCTYARSITWQPNKKRLAFWGSVPHALHARGSSAKKHRKHNKEICVVKQHPQKLCTNRIFSKNIFRLINGSLRLTGHIPQIILHLWGFLCVRDAGHRGNKITAYYVNF